MGGEAPHTMTQTSEIKMSPQQESLFNLAFPMAQEYAQTPTQLFPGSGIAPFGPLEEQAQGMYLAASPVAAGLASQAAGAQSKLLDPDFMLNPNQYVHAAADATTQKVTQNLMESILPGIRSGSTVAGGQYSGGATRQGLAEGRAIEGSNTQLSNALAQMYLANYNTGLEGMSRAIGQNPGVMGQQLFPADILGAVGGQDRALRQAQLDEEIRKFYTQQDIPLLKSQQLMAMISGMPGAQGTTTVSGVAPQTNPLMQALGLGLSVAGMGMGMPGMGMGMGGSMMGMGK